MADVIRHIVKVHTPGLNALPGYVRDEVIRECYSLGDVTRERVRGVMRRGVSPDAKSERGSVKVAVKPLGNTPSGAFTIALSVFSTLIQSLVDETGAVAHFPPWRIGTDLFKWTKGKGLGQDVSKGERQYIRGAAARSVGQRLGRGVVKEHNILVDKQIERVSFLIARRQAGKSPKGVAGGLPRPGDPLRRPFEVTAKALAGLYQTSIDAAIARATAQGNA